MEIKMLYRIVSVCLLWWTTSAVASPTFLTYQGRIVKADGTPLEHSSVSFQFEILNPSGSCVLYREQVNGVNMVHSNGLFDVRIGTSHSYPAAPSFTILDAFDNLSTSLVCDGGSPYSPSVSEGRMLRVQFHDGKDWQIISPDSQIRSVPYAGFAMSAQKLGSKSASDFVLKPTGCSAGQVITFDGTSFSCANGGGGGGGSVTGVTSANAYLTITNPTTAPVLTVNVGTGANTVAAGNDARFTDARNPTGTAGGDLSNNYPNPTVSKIQGRAVDSGAPSTGQVLLWDGTSWKADNVRMQDVRNSWGGTAMIPSTTCAVNEAMVWSVITDRFTCQTIAINASAITAGTISSARLGSGTADNTTYLRGDGTWSTISASDATKLPLAGGTMSGDLNMGGHKITNVSNVPFVAANPAVGQDGQSLRWNNTAGQWEWFTAGAAGAGIVTINGLNGTAQTLAPTSSATSYGFNSAGSTHTLVIPSAGTAGVTAGTISKTEYDAFNAKQAAGNYVTTLSGDVTSSGFAAGTVTTTIANNAVTTVKINDGAVTGAKLEDVSGLVAGTYPKVTVDAKGRVTTGTALSATDIPNLDAAKITTGVLGTARLGTGTADNTTYLRGDGTWAATPTLTETDPKVGANTINYLPKWDGTALVASGVIENSGNIGIGTGSPDAKLSVVDNTSSVTLRLRNSAAAFSTAIGFRDAANVSKGYLEWANSGYAGGVGGVNSFALFTASTDPLALGTNGVARMTITGAGNVGVGVTAPVDKFEVAGKIRATHVCATDGTNCKDLTTSWGSGGSVTSVATGTGLTGGPITTSGTISIAAGGVSATELASNAVTTAKILDANVTGAKLEDVAGLTAGTYGSGTSVPAITVDAKGRVTSVTTNSISGLLPAGSNGQYLKSNGTTWSSADIKFSDIKNGTGTSAFNTGSCAANQTVKWSSLTDMFECQNIGSVDAAAITTGVLGTARLGTGTADNTTYLRGDGTWQAVSYTETDPKVGANTTNYVSKWNGSALVASGIFENSGLVGIGTATPTYDLSLGGGSARTIAMERNTTANSNGNNLTIKAGGASSGASDKNGGDLILSGGDSTGAANWVGSKVLIQGSIGDAPVGATTAVPATTIASFSWNDAFPMLSIGSQGAGYSPVVVQFDGSGSRTYTSSGGTTPYMSSVEVPGYRAINYQWGDGLYSLMELSATNLAGREQSAYIAAVTSAGGSSYTPDMVFGSTSGLTTYSEKMRIASSGNVGIGTTNPGAKLEVNGQVKITGGTPGAGKVLTSDAAGLATWQTPSGGAGTVTSVATGTGLTGGTITTTGTISLADSGVTAGSYGSATAIPAITVDVKGRITAISTNSITGLPSAGTAGKFLKSDGTNWAGSDIKFSDIKNAVGGSAFNVGACAANQTVAWSSLTDSFTCQNIGSLDGSAITAGTIGVARLGTGTADNTKYLRGDGTWQTVSVTETDPKVGANTTNYLSKWNGSTLVTSSVFDNGTSVGVLNSSPSAGYALDVNGAINTNYKLEINRDGNSALLLLQSYRANTNHSKVQMRAARGTASVPAVVSANDIIGELRYDAWTDTTNFGNSANIQAVADATHTATSTPSKLEFYTTASGNTSSSTPAMVIQSDSNITMSNSLRTSGQISTASQSLTVASVDWNSGNTAKTSYDCAGNISFANLRDGGTYTLVVTGTGTTQCSFSTTTTGSDAATVSYRFKPANAARTASSYTVYTFLRVGNEVLVSWTSGF